VKSVYLWDPDVDHGLVKAAYFDETTGWLKPNFCMVDPDGNMLWETNTLGLRGPEVEPDAPIGVVWGDSVVFSTYTRSWPEMLNDFAPSCTFLNGGVEGSSSDSIFSRAKIFNKYRRVEFNVVMPGVNIIGQNATFEQELLTALKVIPNAVLVTSPTSLNEEIVNVDLSDRFRSEGDGETFFRFLGTHAYSLPRQREFFAHVYERNSIIREAAAATRTPLIDLFKVFDSRLQDDFRADFWDMFHLRPSRYPRIAAAVSEALEALAVPQR
jgi:lysophospholipase L1-like esterase